MVVNKYCIQFRPGSDLDHQLSKLFKYLHLDNLYDEERWMAHQHIEMKSKWEDNLFFVVLECESQDAWIEFVLRWL